MTIDHFSKTSLYIELKLRDADKPIAIGSSFIIKVQNNFYLITNWHCVTGRNSETNKILNDNGLADPDIISVYFHTKTIGKWKKIDLELIDKNGNKKWLEHNLGSKIDVVAIPIDERNQIFNEICFYYIDIENDNADLKIYPSIELSIIGYPKGYTAGGKYPIWKKGHLASEYDVSWDDLPLVLIDATTRNGMSGSPVIIKQSGMCNFSNGAIAQGEFVKFIGVYSGRIDDETEIGKVWKPSVIKEIINYSLHYSEKCEQ